MISIKVTAHNGVPMTPPLFGEFDEMGGQIGRAVGSALVLPDPQRHVSRIHASIMFIAGKYVIRDLGTAIPVYLNGRPLGNGHEAPIGEGDEITIAGYTMFVTAERDRPPNLEAEHPKGHAALGAAGQDPLLALGGVSRTSDPFADLISPPPRPSPSVRSTGASREDRGTPKSVEPPAALRSREAAVQPSAIPDDFDPFAEPEPKAGSGSSLDDSGFGFVAARETNIDALFDLPATGDKDPFKPGNPLAAPDNSASSSPNLDPLIAFGTPAATPRSYSSQRNDTPEIHGAFALPKSRPNRGDNSRGDAGSERASSEPIHALPLGSLVQAGAPSPSASRYPNETARPVADAIRGETPVPVPSAFEAPVAHSDTTPPYTGPIVGDARSAETRDTLLREFLAGAGISDVSIRDGLTPELMRLVGLLLHESIQGTLELLLARSATKRLLRADVTMVIAQDNNPLKFSPNAKAALMHLLVPQDHGFMSPERAIKDAYNSLRSHELGFMAGMRAALAGMLARFRPDQLERRLAQNGMVDALLPMARKAKLWDLFAELYSDISKEAEDDFHTLFGREFLRAYEAQIDELERDEQRNKR